MSNNLIGVQNANPAVLVSQYVPSSETTLYSCASLTSVMLGGCALANPSGGAVLVSLSLVKSGGSAGNANRVCVVTLNAGDSTNVPELADQFLGPGDFISAVAGTGSAVSIGISGVVFS